MMSLRRETARRAAQLRKRRAFRAGATALLAAPVAVVVALVLTAIATPLPNGLLGDGGAVSVIVTDRSGRVLRDVRTRSGEIESRVRLDEVSSSVVPALLAAEDARFFSHPGVDVFAVVRASLQALVSGHVVSGASTITQQLARTLAPHRRSLTGKWKEMALALRIEASLDKHRILEEYLSRVPFGPGLRGIDAASRHYLDKPASALDLAEAAELVSLVRGPSLYDPRKRDALVKRRRDRVLARMARRGLADSAAVARAVDEPLGVRPPLVEDVAPHLVLELARRAARDSGLELAGRAATLGSGLELARRSAPDGAAHGVTSRIDTTRDVAFSRAGTTGDVAFSRIDTTLDVALQREVVTLTRRALSDVERAHVTALAAIVLDNETGDVLAYVGSPDYFSAQGGANDGVRALRQPGSTLKPFVYAAAMESLGFTAATLLPDVDLVLDTENGPFAPKNYDGRTHGPVRLRQALASSLNVPAVATAARVGPPRLLDVLHRVGFASLTASAERYGAALALGDGEVRLAELAEAYATLARGGVHLASRVVKSAVLANGARIEEPRAPAARALDSRTTAVLTSILSDDGARAAAFGRASALELPFPVAAKTGTSKGYRDNWTVGFTHEVTVAVWAGNFDGSPMLGSSGITGAAPLFHDVMLAAMRGRDAAPLVDRAGLVEVEVCALSGSLPGPACAHRVRELFRPEDAPRTGCAMHERLAVDPENGLLAGPGCANVEERPFEVYEPRYLPWAKAARRPLPPELRSPRCPARPESPAEPAVAALRAKVEPRDPSVRFPRDGARFVVDADGPSRQEILLAAIPADGGGKVRFVLDGRTLATLGAPYELPWVLTKGRHRFEVASATAATVRGVTFDVEDGR